MLHALGEGGTGTVYKARDVELGRTLALKILHPSCVGDRDSVARFYREAQVLSRLSHQHLVRVFRFGFCKDSSPYIAMEYLEGQSLRSIMMDEPVSLPQSLDIAVQVCQALARIHEAGVVHRDLTPNNIMLLNHSGLVKVIDFGLSMFTKTTTMNQRLTDTGMLIGSVYYMSPEQCAGRRADARSDIYSLGCILYHLVSNTMPFDALNPIALMNKHANEQPPSLQALNVVCPPGLETVILKAMAKSPSQRYQSMSEFRLDLELIIAGQGELIPSNSSVAPESNVVNRLPLALAVSFLVLTVLVLRFHRETEMKLLIRSPVIAADSGRLQEMLRYKSQPVRTQYLRLWLDRHEEDESLDAVQVRHQLAADVKSTEPDFYYGLLEHAHKQARSIFERAMARARFDEAGDALKEILEMGKCVLSPSDRRKELQFMVKSIESKREAPPSLLAGANACRYQIGILLVNDQSVPAALSMFTSILNSSSRSSGSLAVRFSCMLYRSDCLWKLKRTSEAVEQLRAALIYGDRQPKKVSNIWPLAVFLCAEENLDDLCATEGRRASELLMNNGVKAGTLWCMNQARARSLWKLKRFREAFDVLTSEGDNIPTDEQLRVWKMASLINIEGKLGNEQKVLDLLKIQIKQLPAIMHDAEIRQMFCVFSEISGLLVDAGKMADAEHVVNCFLSLRKKWARCPVDDATVTYAKAIATQAHLVGQCNKEREIYRCIMNRILEQRGNNGTTLLNVYLWLLQSDVELGDWQECYGVLKKLNTCSLPELDEDRHLEIKVFQERMLWRLKHRSEAEKFALGILALKRKSANVRYKVDALTLLAEMYISDKKSARARQLLQKAGRICAEQTFPGRGLLISVSLAKLYGEAGQHSVAKKCIKQVFEAARTMPYPITSIFLRELFPLCEQFGYESELRSIAQERECIVHARAMTLFEQLSFEPDPAWRSISLAP